MKLPARNALKNLTQLLATGALSVLFFAVGSLYAGFASAANDGATGSDPASTATTPATKDAMGGASNDVAGSTTNTSTDAASKPSMAKSKAKRSHRHHPRPGSTSSASSADSNAKPGNSNE